MSIRCPLTDTECQKETYEQNDPYLVVLGLQFRSSNYSFTEICSSLEKAVENARLDLSEEGVNVSFKELKFEEDTHIDCSICQTIQVATVPIFEMSDWNPNVMIECGFSIGLNKKPILIRNQKGKELPTDFSGLYRKTYSKPADLVHEVSSKIVKRIRDKQSLRESGHFELLYLNEPVKPEFQAELNKTEIREGEKFITSVFYRGVINGGFFDNKIIRDNDEPPKKYWDPDPNTYKIKDGFLLNPRVLDKNGQPSNIVPGILFGNVQVRSRWRCAVELPKGKYTVIPTLYQNQLDRLPIREPLEKKEIPIVVV